MTYPFLPLSTIDRFVRLAARLKVSTVARGPKGFLTAYRAAGGNPSRLSAYWRRKREGFIARHMAQAIDRHESLFVAGGAPSRRHLALIMWAYSPDERNNP